MRWPIRVRKAWTTRSGQRASRKQAKPAGSARLPGRPRATAAPRHPKSALRRRTPPPPAGRQSLRTRAGLRYTASASDPAFGAWQVVLSKQLLRFPGPMHLPRGAVSGLARRLPCTKRQGEVRAAGGDDPRAYPGRGRVRPDFDPIPRALRGGRLASRLYRPAGPAPVRRAIMASTAAICGPLFTWKSAPVKPHQSQQPSGLGQGMGKSQRKRSRNAAACG